MKKQLHHRITTMYMGQGKEETMQFGEIEIRKQEVSRPRRDGRSMYKNVHIPPK